MTQRHISVSGDLGSGKSSVTQLLSRSLDIPLVSTGDIHRQIAASLNLSTLETNILAETDEVIDRQVDGVTARLGEEATAPFIFDSRIAWYILSSSFKVRLLVDPEVAAARVFSRSSDAVETYRTLDEARVSIGERYESELRRFSSRYGIDVTDLRQFNLVIDTSDASLPEVAAAIREDYVSGRTGGLRLLASPRRLVEAFVTATETVSPVAVVYARPSLVAVAGRESLQAALADGRSLLEVRLITDSSEVSSPGGTPRGDHQPST